MLNETLPYSKANPVIYDNDCPSDVYTDELLLALSSAGEISLRGVITTSPANPAVTHETFEFDSLSRQEILAKARRSGLSRVPPHFRGPRDALISPRSGIIEDTRPLETDGTRFIIGEALKADPALPVVIAMGGPLTVAADAWLLDHRVADRLVVSWLGGNTVDMFDYNAWADPWAAYIALCRLRMVQFPVSAAAPEVPKARLVELPETELRQWMMDKRLPHVNKLPAGLTHDGDAQPVISLVRPDYARRTRRVSFGRWGLTPGGERIPVFKDDAAGNVIMVAEADAAVATEEWWRIMKNPAAWHGPSAAGTGERQRPLYAAAFPVGLITRVEAEDFDLGGELVAFHKHTMAASASEYRQTGVEIVEARDRPGGYNAGADGGYAVAGMVAGEWLEYTIQVEEQAEHALMLRAAACGGDGAACLAIDGTDVTGSVRIPPADADHSWHDVACGVAVLPAGRHVLRLTFGGGPGMRAACRVNYIGLRPTGRQPSQAGRDKPAGPTPRPAR